MKIKVKEIQALIDEKMRYGKDWYSEQVLMEFEKEGDKHLITRNRLNKYIDKYDTDREKIQDENGYIKEGIEIMLEDEKINKLLHDQIERKTVNVEKLGKVPNCVAEYYEERKELYDSWYDEDDVLTEEVEKERIRDMLNKKAGELSKYEVEELYQLTFSESERRVTKVWNPK